MSEGERQIALRRAIRHFNDPATRDEYFELYDESVVLHGYPPGVVGLEDAKRFYRGLWGEHPDWALAITEIDDLDDCLRVRFTYGPNEGVTTLRYDGTRVVERWQGS